MTVHPQPAEFQSRRVTPSTRPPITVALVNNMPDAALRATERQFRYLVARSTRAQDVNLQVYYLPDVPRGEVGERHCRTHYRPIDELLGGSVDAMIVTGCEPRAASLRDEPFWQGFTEVVDWARTHTRSALWSCLAAHAAVLHLDGIERHRLDGKLSGVFCSDKAKDHALLDGVHSRMRIPHSRYNTLSEQELQAKGYEVLTRSERVGPDIFVKEMPSLFVFLQGHPEYEGDSLGREFRRDLDRFTNGATTQAPRPPESYFDELTAERLAVMSAPDGKLSKSDLAMLRELVAATPCADWRGPAAQVYRNWLTFVADLRRAELDERNAGMLRLAVGGGR